MNLRRSLIVLCFLAAFAVSASAQLFTLQGGNFQVAGVPVANGSVILTLSNPSATICIGGGAATPTYTINLDSLGNMPLTQVLGNGALCPQGTFYTAQLFTAASGGGTLISTNTWIVGPSAPYSGTLYPNVMVLPAVSFTGGVTVPSANISFSATPTFNAATVSKFYITLTGNVTSSTLTGAVKDQLLIFVISEDGVGGRTFVWPSNVKGHSIATGAGLTSTQAFSYDGTNAWPIGELTVSSGNVDVNVNHINTTGSVTIAGSSGLTAAGTGGQTAGGFTTPSAIRHYCGDGTGWRCEFAKRVGSVDTIEGWITDGGVMNVLGSYQVNGSQINFTNLASGTSAQLAAVISDETGSGAAVFGTSPSLTTPAISSPTSTGTDSGTETLKNKTMTAAGSGNNTDLLNSQDSLTAVTGNGTDQTLYTFSIPANTVQAGKGVNLKLWVQTNNTVSVTYKVILGTTTLLTWTSTAASGSPESVTADIFNNSGVQNAQTTDNLVIDNATIIGNGVVTSAENFANALTLKVTASEANPNTVTPKKWILRLVQ